MTLKNTIMYGIVVVLCLNPVFAWDIFWAFCQFYVY